MILKIEASHFFHALVTMDYSYRSESAGLAVAALMV